MYTPIYHHFGKISPDPSSHSFTNNKNKQGMRSASMQAIATNLCSTWVLGNPPDNYI
jgi:hypothetical protein